MKRSVGSVLVTALCLALSFGMVSCSKKSSGGNASGGSDSKAKGLDMSKKVKIGVLVSDATTPEALGFRTYYEKYIQKVYNVEFIYSDELKDAAGEKSAIDTMITVNCKGIISLSSFDRPAQIQQCEAAKIYYAVATGTLTAEQYEANKASKYYVGAIGPSLDIEYKTGYDMAKHYLDNGKTKFAIFGGAVPYRTEMHIHRVVGMLQAMIDNGGSDANYEGCKTTVELIGKIMGEGKITPCTIGNAVIMDYLGGYDMDDAFFAKVGEMARTPDLEVLLCVGNGSDFFGTAVTGTNVKIASVDAFAENYGKAMESGVLDYLAGKFSAAIGPIFIALYRAVLGDPLRNPSGNAFALDQGYWIAKSYGDFQKFYAIGNDLNKPAYSKEDLDPLLTADYTDFANFVSRYDFDSISK